MRKLLSANTKYCFQTKTFWLEIIVCAILSVWIIFANYSAQYQQSEEAFYLEDVFFTIYQIAGMILSVSISMIVGTEYSDGTLRNKLIIGHTRFEIYFSMLCSNIIATLLMMLVHGITSYAIGYFLFGSFHLAPLRLLLALLGTLFSMLVFTAFFVAIAMNCSNKSVTVAGSVIAAYIVALTAGLLQSKLLEPETTYSQIVITENGISYGDIIPNPAYVSGISRSICEFFYDLLPSGQLIQINSLNFAHSQYWLPLSGLLFVVITFVGYTLFKKKDIK